MSRAIINRRTLLACFALAAAIGAGIWFILPSDQAHSAPAGQLIPAASYRGAIPGPTPVVALAPQFSFPDQDNTPITTQTLKGKVWIADFIFTHCAGTCPRMTAKRVELQKQITDPRVMFLSFSVDPERDDRATRKSYAAEKQVDETRWKFVSPPSKDAALRIAQAMKIAAFHGREHDPILHSDRFVLIDAQARVHGSYQMDDADEMKRLIADALALASDPAAK